MVLCDVLVVLVVLHNISKRQTNTVVIRYLTSKTLMRISQTTNQMLPFPFPFPCPCLFLFLHPLVNQIYWPAFYRNPRWLDLGWVLVKYWNIHGVPTVFFYKNSLIKKKKKVNWRLSHLCKKYLNKLNSIWAFSNTTSSQHNNFIYISAKFYSTLYTWN